jgi:hypothetical protein
MILITVAGTPFISFELKELALHGLDFDRWSSFRLKGDLLLLLELQDSLAGFDLFMIAAAAIATVIASITIII